VRLTLRILAIISLAVLGIGLFLDITSYVSNPCPRVFFYHSFLAFFGVYGLLTTVVGSAVGASFAIARRRWGWLVGLLVASIADSAFLYGAALDSPPPVVLTIVNALSWTVDQAPAVTTCGSYSSPFVQAAAVILVLLAAPVTLLSYSLFGFPAPPETT